MHVVPAGKYIYVFDSNGERDSVLEDRYNKIARKRRASHKAGQRKSKQRPTRDRKAEQHVSGRNRTIFRNREDRRLCRDAMNGIEIV